MSLLVKSVVDLSDDPDYQDLKVQVEDLPGAFTLEDYLLVALLVDERLSGGPRRSVLPDRAPAQLGPRRPVPGMEVRRDWHRRILHDFVHHPVRRGRPGDLKPYLREGGVKRAILLLQFIAAGGREGSHALNVVYRGGDYWVLSGVDGYVGLLDRFDFLGADKHYHLVQTDPAAR